MICFCISTLSLSYNAAMVVIVVAVALFLRQLRLYYCDLTLLTVEKCHAMTCFCVEIRCTRKKCKNDIFLVPGNRENLDKEFLP